MDLKSIWVLFFVVVFHHYIILTTVSACENSLNELHPTDKVNESQQRDIIKLHNEYRNLVRQGKAKTRDGNLPKAKNMNDLKWHKGLSDTAQQLTNRCVFEHVLYDVEPFGRVGQNLYVHYSSAPLKKCDFAGAIRSWYDEIKEFSKKQIDPFKFTSETGHFTQVVWADTTHVGCGCTNYKDKHFPYAQIIACNYGPVGNVNGGQMYQT